MASKDDTAVEEPAPEPVPEGPSMADLMFALIGSVDRLVEVTALQTRIMLERPDTAVVDRRRFGPVLTALAERMFAPMPAPEPEPEPEPPEGEDDG